jgi:hypothetical protein
MVGGVQYQRQWVGGKRICLVGSSETCVDYTGIRNYGDQAWPMLPIKVNIMCALDRVSN